MLAYELPSCICTLMGQSLPCKVRNPPRVFLAQNAVHERARVALLDQISRYARISAFTMAVLVRSVGMVVSMIIMVYSSQ